MPQNESGRKMGAFCALIEFMKNNVRIAVAGAGLAGLRHMTAICRAEGCELAAAADPDARGAAAARRLGVACYESLPEMLESAKPDGAVIATPSALHAEHGMACARAGIPALVEKPIAVDAAEGRALTELASALGVPLLAGHHRRHNALVAAARAVLREGLLGRLTMIDAKTWLMKPDDYFAAEWRRKKGAGPIFINLIHDLDLLRHLCGEVLSVHAMESRGARGLEVEDGAAILLRFENGALGTMSVSDATVGPWSWELTARENPAYAATGDVCYWIGGTHGSLALPNLTLWRHPGSRGWWRPIAGEKLVFDFGEDPFVRQMRHFAAVIRGAEEPLISGEDALRSLAAVEAVKESATSGRTIQLSGNGGELS